MPDTESTSPPNPAPNPTPAPGSAPNSPADATGTATPESTLANTPSPLVFPPSPQDSRLVVLREVTTTTIAMVILAVTCYMMLKTFANAGGDFQKMKDIMLYALPILGTVMGYYFGRVPAERRAEASEKEAQQAQATAQSATVRAIQTQQQTDQKMQQVKLAMERVKARVASGEGGAPAEEGSELLGATRRGSSGGGAKSGGNAALHAELDNISRML